MPAWIQRHAVGSGLASDDRLLWRVSSGLEVPITEVVRMDSRTFAQAMVVVTMRDRERGT